MKNIILVAGPAAGKGTQAKLLVDAYNYIHISVGDLLRSAAKEDTDEGDYIKECLSKGILINEDLMKRILEIRITQDDCKNGYILDGFPRTLEQAKYYDEMIERLNFDLGVVIFIDVLKEELEKRVLNRRTCEKCGSIYSIKSLTNASCSKCNGKLVIRSDDNKEAFEIRYQTYLNMTKPLIDFYDNKGLLFKVDGGINKETTFNSIVAILNK